MKQLYTCSPITSKLQFEAALQYIVHTATLLGKELTGKKLAVASVKVFAHYPEEFAYMKKILQDYGSPAGIGRSTSIYVASNMVIDGNHIQYIGIRVPDPYRLQTGCVDFALNDATAFARSLPKHEHGYIRPFPDMPEHFIELWHPDYDVAGYIPLR